MRSRTLRAAGEGRDRLGLSGRATLEDGVPGVHGIELVCGLEKDVRERLDGPAALRHGGGEMRVRLGALFGLRPPRSLALLRRKGKKLSREKLLPEAFVPMTGEAMRRR